jgi:uncharacterized membrane protein YqgA involved in biofilm formation
MKKIVTASRLKAGCKWVSCVSFVMGVSMFVNDALIRDVTTLDAGIFMVSMSVFVTAGTAEWIADAVDRIATISFAGAMIALGGFLLSDTSKPTAIWLEWPTGIQITAGILMVVFSAVFMVRAWQIDARG